MGLIEKKREHALGQYKESEKHEKHRRHLPRFPPTTAVPHNRLHYGSDDRISGSHACYMFLNQELIARSLMEKPLNQRVNVDLYRALRKKAIIARVRERNRERIERQVKITQDLRLRSAKTCVPNIVNVACNVPLR